MKLSVTFLGKQQENTCGTVSVPVKFFCYGRREKSSHCIYSPGNGKMRMSYELCSCVCVIRVQRENAPYIYLIFCVTRHLYLRASSLVINIFIYVYRLSFVISYRLFTNHHHSTYTANRHVFISGINSLCTIFFLFIFVIHW